ncbi:MAG: hypothetical protein JNJ59_15725, partial [Deltaproteobacteria bacterium]|nr:hypothetical protein [Deltaproteobacteria bacterium]
MLTRPRALSLALALMLTAFACGDDTGPADTVGDTTTDTIGDTTADSVGDTSDTSDTTPTDTLPGDVDTREPDGSPVVVSIKVTLAVPPETPRDANLTLTHPSGTLAMQFESGAFTA